ncbi:hypothetical protein MTO96_046936 [Rhipicephalus appendiculatus]
MAFVMDVAGVGWQNLQKNLATHYGANDITVWCMGGSNTGVEQALQLALNITENFLSRFGPESVIGHV